jgi:predicted RecA/RadA family phage recombinase
MLNLVQDSADNLVLTAPYQRNAGQAALVGKIFGVAITTVASGATAAFATEGIFTITKNTGFALAVGDSIYWDDTNKYITNVASGNAMVGLCTKTAASGDTTAQVKLTGSAVTRKFISTEQTGTGSAQNVAHGLGVIPAFVQIQYSDLTPATAGSVNTTYGTHTTTNVVVTVTLNKKFYVIAEA